MPTGAQASVRPEFPRFYFLLLVILHFSGSLLAQPQDEALALIQFKSSLLDPSTALFNWNPATSPCSGEQSNWVGVLCYDGYVWGLQLERMNLGGRIDVDALQPLKFLRTASFMGNNFDGPMPDWKKVGAIKALYLSDNQFSGEIPVDAFKGMYSLKKVHLANNKFSGPIPTSLESPKLIELKLENNQFTGGIPMISSENLKVLDLSNNQLEGSIPAALGKMPPASFTGNKALCGEPLGTPCPSSPPPPPAAAAIPPKPSKKSPIGLIIACIIIGIILLLLILLLVRRSRQQENQSPQLGTPTPTPATTDVERNNPNLPTPVAAPRAPEGGPVVAPAKKSEQHQPGKLSFVEETRQKFDLQDLMRASAEVLGSGNFGASYKAVLVDGESLVVKRFKQMNGIAREEFHEHMRRLGRLKHPNLLPLVAYLFRKEEKLLVSDFVVNGSLATHLHGKQAAALKWGTRLKIIKGIAKGLIYLQNEVPSIAVAHGHLKSSNVLLDKDYNPLLMDYALLPIVNAANVHHVLLAYKSPEYAQTGRITKKSDVWCLGTLILEILTGRYVTYSAGADMAAWVNGIAGEDASAVLDKGMAAAAGKGQMEKMLQVGIKCCVEDAEKRWDLEEAVRQIEAIQSDD